MVRKLVFILYLGVIVTACQDDSPGPTEHAIQAQRGQIAEDDYLPYGVPVPENVVVTKFPEPFNLLKHGNPRNVAIPGRARAARRRMWRQSMLGTAPQQQDANGALLTSSEGAINVVNHNEGFAFGADIQTDVVLPNAQGYLFAPTFLPSSTACLEITIVHARQGTGSPQEDYLGIWNWCDPLRRQYFQWSWDFDTNFRTNYVRTTSPTLASNEPAEPMIYAVLEKANGRWIVRIFNYRLGVYENLIPNGISGTPYVTMTGTQRGWTMYEWESANFDCPLFPNIKAANIQTKTTDWGGGVKEFSYLWTDEILSTRATSCFVNNSPWAFTPIKVPNNTYWWWHAYTD